MTQLNSMCLLTGQTHFQVFSCKLNMGLNFFIDVIIDFEAQPFLTVQN